MKSSSSTFRRRRCRTFSGALFDLFPRPFVTPGWLVFWDKNRDGLTRHFPFISTFECFRTRAGDTVPFSVHSAFFLVYTSGNNTQFFSDCAHKCRLNGTRRIRHVLRPSFGASSHVGKFIMLMKRFDFFCCIRKYLIHI